MSTDTDAAVIDARIDAGLANIKAGIEGLLRVRAAAWALYREIDNCYDVDEGRGNLPGDVYELALALRDAVEAA